jgi:hypothetical protein
MIHALLGTDMSSNQAACAHPLSVRRFAQASQRLS